MRRVSIETAAVEFEEFLSRSVCQLVTPVGPPHGGDARPHATARQALIPPPVRHRKPCGSQAGTGHTLTERGGVPRLPQPTCEVAVDAELGILLRRIETSEGQFPAT
jgi:hypothetical protein